MFAGLVRAIGSCVRVALWRNRIDVQDTPYTRVQLQGCRPSLRLPHAPTGIVAACRAHSYT